MESMPIYEYQPSTADSCEFCSGGFEVMQKINEQPLEACPRCGSPIVRLISAASIPKSGPGLDQHNLEKHGFTQYKRAGKGVYEKTAGKGPRVIKDD